MKNLNLIFKLLLFPLILVFFTSEVFSEDENGNTCNEAQALLTGGLLAASDSGSSANGDKDYFSFTVAGNGELNVTITNTNATASNAPKLEYSVLTLGSSPCVTASAGQLNAQFSTTQTISITTAGTYYIFLEGTKNNPATTYDISALFTPGASTGGVDLSISKTGSVDSLLIFDTFFYTINVSNVGDTNASNVTVTDDLPSNMRVDIDATNADLASDGWACDGETITTICTLTGDLIPGSLSSIKLHVKAPPTDGIITNEVNVTSSADGNIIDTDINPSNNQATAVTEVISDIDTAAHLCYDERTEILNDDFNTTCEKKGNFYYGSGCDAYVTIRENNITDIISSPKIYKMYADATSSGSCTYTAQGSTFGPQSNNCNNVSNSNDFGSYEDGYAIIIDENSTSNLVVDINDTDTDNNPRIDGVAMFGDYYYEVTVEGTLLSFHHFGRIFACSGISEGGIEVTTSADIIDTPIGVAANSAIADNYNASVVPNPTPFDPTDGNIKYIQTMVAATTTRNIEGVHLDLGGVATVYQYAGTEDGDVPYQITPYLTNDNCDDLFENITDPTTGRQLVIDVPSGSYSATGQMIVDEAVRQVARMQMIFIDPNTLSPEGQNCLANSSTTGNFARLAQCVNSEVQYTTAFGQDAWDRCGEGNGNPCDSANHGYSCGEDDTTCDEYNPLYDNELGCYMCTFNIQPSCSTDNFAIRPEKFDMEMSDTDAPNLLRAGEEYDISLTARDALDNIPAEYTVTDHNFNADLDTNTTRYFKDGTVDTNNLLHGTSDLNTSTTAYMVAGLSSLTTTQPASAQEIVQVSYDDVGLVGLQVYDKNWAAVDNDDTPMDCNSTTHTYICGESNVTFIPHHFTVNNIHLRNHRDGNFTYLSNDLNMSAHLDVNISAMNADDEITQNFQQGSLYYENPISVDINVTEWNASIPVTTRHPLGNSTHKHDIPTETLLGFGGSDENGTHNIPWNETNTTQQLMFNYTRNNNQPVNPFILNGTDVNITVQSTYTDLTGMTPSSPTVIDGSGIADRNATFYFARTKSSQFFYDDVINSVQTPISVVVYCDTYPTCSELNNEIKINEPYWWLSVDHDEVTGDGNITLASPPSVIPAGAGNPTITPDVDITIIPAAQPGVDTDVNVNSGPNPSLPMTAEIFLNTTGTNTNSWLIYNTASDIADPDPFYKVRFIGVAGWAGHGDTGHVVDSNTSAKKNRRLGW